MENLVSFELKKESASPWGLFLDDPNLERPLAIVWLTTAELNGQCDRALLSDADIERIRSAIRAGIVEVKGLKEVENEKVIRPPWERQGVATPIKSKGGDQGERISDILELEEKEVLSKLKQAVISGANLAFFTRCRKEETNGKCRNPVLGFLNSTIDEIVATINVAGERVDPFTGKSRLSDAYWEMIEEYDDEEEEDSKTKAAD